MHIVLIDWLLSIILKVVSYGSEEVAEKAIMILKDVFTNLGPRLLANQVSICCFLYYYISHTVLHYWLTIKDCLCIYCLIETLYFAEVKFRSLCVVKAAL